MWASPWAAAVALALTIPAPVGEAAANTDVRDPHPTSDLTVGVHVPWADGGLYLDAEGSLTREPEVWPAARVPAVRLWDTRTTWAHLEPRDDDFRFDTLDAQVDAALAHGTRDILLVLAATPAWAAQDPTAVSAPWLTTGSASPPADIAQWEQFVEVVATRYRGRITAYQIGNEPNLDWFFQGTPRQLRAMVDTAAAVIDRVDPDALVVAAGPLVTDRASVTGARRWWRALRGADVDAHAVQWYPRTRARPVDLVAIMHRVRRFLPTDARVWITEVNFAKATTRTAADQRTLVRRTHRVAARAGAHRLYWYAWSQRISPRMLTLQQHTPAGRALLRWWRTTGQPSGTEDAGQVATRRSR